MKEKKDLSGAHLALAAGITVVVAGGLDMLGEPPAAWHPVVWYGKLISLLEQTAPFRRQYRSKSVQRGSAQGPRPAATQPPIPMQMPQVPAQFLYGIAMLMLATPIAILPAVGIRALAQRIQQGLARRGYPCFGILLSALLQGVSLKPFFALRMLADAGGTVRQALERDDLLAARHALHALVSRDCSRLTAELLAAAAIESLAENLSDSVVAPLFYYVWFGVPGAAAYRLFNTFDSMIGYHGRYEYLGKVAARLDDVLNFVPARLTALLIIVLAPVFGGNRRAAWRIWRRDARKTESPNAGHPMAAMAGALGIQLEKVDHYILGEPEFVGTGQGRDGQARDGQARDGQAQGTVPTYNNSPQASHLRQAEQMVWRIGVDVIALTAVLTFLIRSGKWSKQVNR